jgi:hypothetical protein
MAAVALTMQDTSDATSDLALHFLSAEVAIAIRLSTKGQ